MSLMGTWAWLRVSHAQPPTPDLQDFPLAANPTVYAPNKHSHAQHLVPDLQYLPLAAYHIAQCMHATDCALQYTYAYAI